MRVKEIHTVISTNNWARYTIKTFGHGIIYSRASYSELPARIKNLHVQSFQLRNGKIIIYVRECVR